MKKKKMKNKHNNVNEPQPAYNRITITTLADLEENDREHTRNMTHEQRMEYLQKLNFNLYGPDLSKQEAELKKRELKIRKTA